MDLLRFAHHFFHFESLAWARFRASGGNARDLFASRLLPRRVLRRGEPRDLAMALREHERLIEREQELGIRSIAEGEIGYPEALLQIPPERRPALIYLRGQEVPPERHLVGIVGTRNPSDAGCDEARSFSAYLSALGIRVVSGLARGIDTIVHEASLELGAIAVLGSGVGSVYPPENQPLAERLLRDGGTLLSPFPLEQVPLPQNFPDRNELIAALAAGVVVIEGAPKSGAAITGRMALAQGKCVVALTRDFRSEFGRGAIGLHREGAELVTCEEEAVEALFRRFGGFGGGLPFPKEALPKRATFSFAEFRAASDRTVPEAVALLEEGILQGKIQRAGQRYRLT